MQLNYLFIIMTSLFKKLNFKQHPEICIVNHPAEFEDELQAINKYTVIKTKISECKELEFILAFVKTKAQIDKVVSVIQKKIKGDGIVWFAYPKGTSKKYKAEINRDNGWQELGNIGMETVRAVAIDEDWSALRFRKVEFVKSMTRHDKMILSPEGKSKTKKIN